MTGTCHVRIKRHQSEVDQVAHFDAEAISNAAEQIYPDADLPGFNLPYMGLVAANHQRELSLRKALPLSMHANSGAQTRLSVDVAHA